VRISLADVNFARFGTYFFTLSGVQNAFIITVITSVCAVAGSATAFPLIRYIGRRPILLGGAAVCAISMLAFAIVGAAAPNSIASARCLVAFSCLYIFTYGATWGPVAQVVIGEIASNKLRSKTLAIATTINWMCTLFIVCGTPYLISISYANLGPKVGFIFGGCTVLTCFWTFFFLPETKDRTLEQIDEMFLNVSIPITWFSLYIFTITSIAVNCLTDTLNRKSRPANSRSTSLRDTRAACRWKKPCGKWKSRVVLLSRWSRMLNRREISR
jgi:SP family sugar:H+ symporter-like MFS transporter